jgi:hypothetical protein
MVGLGDKPAPSANRSGAVPSHCVRRREWPLGLPIGFAWVGTLLGRRLHRAVRRETDERRPTEFRDKCCDLEERMRALAEADGDVFLPNSAPSEPASHVFICMEPSLGAWARSKEEAEAKIAAGFRNFHHSVEDFLLHFAIRRYLLEPGESYHLTDVSKGAMLVARAGRARRERYARWYELLREELDLVARGDARIFAVGGAVESFLRQQALPQAFTRILHFSGVAARARAEGIVGQEAAFEHHCPTVDLGNVITVADAVLARSRIPEPFRSAALARVSGARLTVSRKQLLFNYKLAFGAVRP